MADPARGCQPLWVHHITVAKWVRRGLLYRRKARSSLSRDEIVNLTIARVARAPQANHRLAIHADASAPLPPDDEQDWLTSNEAEAVMGATRNAVNHSARLGWIP